MAFALPSCPPVASFDIDPDTLRAENSPPLGGPDSRFPRLGSRHVCDVVLENMTAAQAQAWQNRLSSEDQTVVFAIPTRGLDIGDPGTPLVDGSGQTGSTLKVKGVPAGYVVKENQPVPVVSFNPRTSADQVFFYRARGPATANGSGVVDIPLNVIIRFPHLNNDAVLLAAPVIEGFVQSYSGFDIKTRRLNGQGLVEGARFSIKERR